ncbi:uncharacterized protein [Euphorbia lathyris]|uniref:uncharacterized protein isoform X1 n=1 Tax=Euphorbia lathyris TaxID=212925 RepID=UPI003313D9F8
MGSAISKAADGFGHVVGNVFSAPFKNMFGASCEDICAGPWDVLCFIEHLCVSNLVKLLLILGLCYIGFLFFYVTFQLGICQCIGRSLCNMCWAACYGYWYSLKYITCFCWYKLKNTKRVYRRRRMRTRPRVLDIESSESEYFNQPSICIKRKSVREGRKAQLLSSRRSSYHHRHHHHRSGRGISLRVKGGSDRLRINSRKLHMINVKIRKRNVGSSKRRRLK